MTLSNDDFLSFDQARVSLTSTLSTFVDVFREWKSFLSLDFNLSKLS